MLGCSCPWFAARFLIVAITESMTSLSLKASAAGAKTATETRRNITPPRAERPEAFPVRAAILSYLAPVASVARPSDFKSAPATRLFRSPSASPPPPPPSSKALERPVAEPLPSMEPMEMLSKNPKHFCGENRENLQD